MRTLFLNTAVVVADRWALFAVVKTTEKEQEASQPLSIIRCIIPRGQEEYYSNSISLIEPHVRYNNTTSPSSSQFTINSMVHPLRRTIFLAYTAFVAQQQLSNAFTSHLSTRAQPQLNIRFGSSTLHSLQSGTALYHGATEEEEDRSRPNIVKIKTHEDYVNFLEEDDRICVVK